MLWDFESSKLRLKLKDYGQWVGSVAWSPDGQIFASGYWDGKIRLWEYHTGELRHTLEGHVSTVTSIAWSPDGRTLASGSADRTVRLWEPMTGQMLRTLEGSFDQVNSVVWSPAGETLAFGTDDGEVRRWDARSRRFRPKLKGHSDWVYSVAWSPDGRTLASGSKDKTIRLWDAKTGRHRLTIEGHLGSVTSISFSSNGHLLASKSSDGTVKLWLYETGMNTAVLSEPASTYWPPSLAFHPAAPVLATPGKKDTVVHIWDVDFNAILGATPEQEDVLYTTAKITLVGDSGVGKTGLGWRLAHGRFKEHPSTHGQQFWVIDELGATRGDRTQCEAVLWDLAGQPDYRLVHALFLDDVDLALVLFDPTNRQEPLKGVEYWLKQLKRGRRDGRKRREILVGARADRGVPTLTREELEEFCRRQGVEAYVGTSALTGEGLAELLARVRSSIVWDEMPATVTTKTFKRVKEFVLALKEEPERKGVLVSPAELRARLEATDAEWDFTDAEMVTAVRHLSTHGYVSVLRSSSGEETILLAPDLLVNLASSLVLEARRNPKGLGALEEARVLAGEYAFPELVGLEERERDVLLDAAVVLFIERNLCFRETLGAQTLLIFPALINQKRPAIEEVETVDDYSYRVTGAVENIYAALVVQLGYTNTFTRTNQWQNQAEYETARGDVCGFRQVNEREGEIELVLYYSKEKAGARPLFQGLFEEFLRGRDVDITKFPPVQCPKCGYRQQRTEVVKRIGEGKGFLFCGECGKKIALPKEGERVALSQPQRRQLGREQERTRRRTAFESALVRVKAVVRDEKKEAPSCFVSYAWGDEGQERWVRNLGKDLENAGVTVILDQKDNPQLGANVARFIGRIVRSDFVVVVGTPLYREKYENEVSAAGSVVAAEVDLINQRLTRTEREKVTVLPLLLEGDEETSFPPLVRGRVYGRFDREESYFPSLFDLILTLYRIPFNHPAVEDLRDTLRPSAGRRG
jgi:GTPase SAR1 family protein